MIFNQITLRILLLYTKIVNYLVNSFKSCIFVKVNKNKTNEINN